MNYNALRLVVLLSGLLFVTHNNCTQFDPGTHAQQQAIEQGIKTTCSVIGTQLNEELTYRRTKDRALTPVEAAAESNHTKSAALADAQKLNAEQSSKLINLQIEEAKIDKLNKLLETSHKLSSVSDGEDNDDKVKIMTKRIEKQLDELAKDLPELTEEELEKIVPKKTDDADSQPPRPKTSWSSMLATPFVFAFTKAGQGADFLAGYSFAHLTNLDCFKDTFIGNNSQNINRLLVATTVIAMGYAAYKYKNRNNDEDDDFDDEF